MVTARALADHLKVSERTIYRDVADLIASQVPIEGAAGIGYSLRKGYDLPPLMFTESELDALVFGARNGADLERRGARRGSRRGTGENRGRAAGASSANDRGQIAVSSGGRAPVADHVRSGPPACGDSRPAQAPLPLSRREGRRN